MTSYVQSGRMGTVNNYLKGVLKMTDLDMQGAGQVRLEVCGKRDKIGRLILDEGKVAKAFIDTKSVKTDGESLFVFNARKQFWQRCTRRTSSAALRSLLVDEDKLAVAPSKLQKIFDLLLEANEIVIEPQALAGVPTTLHVKNGVVDLTTGKLRAINTSDFFTYVVEINYYEDLDDMVKMPAFAGFLKTSLGDNDRPKNYDDNVTLLREILGVAITDLSGVKTAFFLIGKSNAGKSVLGKLLRSVVRETSSLGLHEFGDRFRLSLLKNQRINIADEIRQTQVQALDNFKRIVSEDFIVTEEKGCQPVNTIINSKLVFIGNALPELGEYDCRAVVNRITLLLFNNSIEKNNWIPDLAERLIAEKDLIFSWALKAIPKLIANNFTFTKPEASTSYLCNYIAEANSAEAFIKDCCICGEDRDLFRVHGCDLERAYANYCASNCLKEQPYAQLKVQVSALCGVVGKKFRINGSGGLAGYLGIRLKSAAEFAADAEGLNEEGDTNA